MSLDEPGQRAMAWACLCLENRLVRVSPVCLDSAPWWEFACARCEGSGRPTHTPSEPMFCVKLHPRLLGVATWWADCQLTGVVRPQAELTWQAEAGAATYTP